MIERRLTNHICMDKVIVITAAIILSAFSLSSLSASVTGEVGKPIKVPITLPSAPLNLEQCSIKLFLPEGQERIVTLAAPNFASSIEVTIPSPGSVQVRWIGVQSLKGEEVSNPIEGAARQLFGNLGELLQTQRPTSTYVLPCPGSGSYSIEAVAARTAAGALTDSRSQVSQKPFEATARVPQPPVKPPIESLAFRTRYNEDAQYRAMIDGFLVERSRESLVLLRLFSDKEDAYAQFLFGRAHTEPWTGLSNPGVGCYWLRRAAVGGLSQARILLANLAFESPECFDVKPTLEEARIWAELARMSSDKDIRTSAEKLLEKILKATLEGRR